MADTTVPFSERPVLGRFTQQVAAKGGYWGGLQESVKMGGEDIKRGINIFSDASKGHRAVAFGRVTGVGAGLAIGADALLRSKTADGEERGMLGRLFQAVVGLGVTTASLVVGKGR